MGIMAINNAIRDIKKFSNVQRIHRGWNSLNGVFGSCHKVGENSFIHYFTARDLNEKTYRYISTDGKTLTTPVEISITYNDTIVPADSRIMVSIGFVDTDNCIYLVLNVRSIVAPFTEKGFYIAKAVGPDYTSFTVIGYHLLPVGAMDNVPTLFKFGNYYYIYGRKRGTQDWGSLGNAVLEDRRAVRILRSPSLTATLWTEVGIVGGDTKVSSNDNILDPIKFYEKYHLDGGDYGAYVSSTIKKDFYAFLNFNVDGNIIGVANTYVKNINRPLILRNDRNTSGTGEAYPTLFFSKNAETFTAISTNGSISGNVEATFLPDEVKRTVGGNDYDIPSTFEKGQGFLVPEFGQIGPIGFVETEDKVLFYFGNRTDTHYRPVSYPDISVSDDLKNSYLNNSSPDDLLQPTYDNESSTYEAWYASRLATIKSLRGLNESHNKEYEWVPISEADVLTVINDVPTRTQDEVTSGGIDAKHKEAYQRPAWIYVAEIPKNRFGSWKSNGAGAYVDTKTIPIPANADFIQVNHIGNVGVSVIIIGSPFSIGTVTGDSINSLVNISNYKGQSLKLRFYLLEDNTSELFSFNFVRDINAPVSPLSLIIPEVNQIVPKEWTVFKWTPVGGAVNGTTQYTIGVEGNTNTNTHPKLIRTRTGIDVGTYNTVLTSTSPVSAANSISITIADALVSSDSTQITFRRSAGVSNYKVEFATDNGFSNIIRTENLAQQLTGDKYPIGEQTLDLTQFNFADGTYYWRISATVPGEDTTQRAPTVFGNFTIALGAITIEDWTPIIDSPANNATITKTGNLIIFKDDSVNGSDYDKTGFQFQFSNLANFSTIHNTVFRIKIGRESGNLFTVSVGGMGAAFPLGTTTSRYWRVRAYVDAVNGPFSQWSEIRRVTVTP
jgi:hypothetical protein